MAPPFGGILDGDAGAAAHEQQQGEEEFVIDNDDDDDDMLVVSPARVVSSPSQVRYCVFILFYFFGVMGL